MYLPHKQSAPSAPKRGQVTLLGFFKKVDPSLISPSVQATAQPNATPAHKSSSKQATGAVKEAQSYARDGLLPSPPSSVSGGSVSPVASCSKPSASGGLGRQRIGANVSPPDVFKKPLSRQGVTVIETSRNTPSGIPRPQEHPLTPPASSPPPSEDLMDVDDDNDDEVPTLTRRRSVTKKRKAYYESGSEQDDDGSDYEQAVKRSEQRPNSENDDDAADEDVDGGSSSDASASPRPARHRGAKAARTKPAEPAKSRSGCSPAAKKPRQSLCSFGASSSRPPIIRASTSNTSAGSRVSPAEKTADGSNSFSFLVDRRDIDGNRPGDAEFDPRTLYIPNSWWAKMTNFEKQYFEIKQYNMDTILMFQKGKFYEMFLEDARIAHQKLDLKLTDRGRMPMVGVPESSFDLFATKLLALGFKVGRVDQMETAVAKGMREKSSSSDIVRRELRHVMTSGTMIEGLEDDQANYCIALIENIRGVDGQDDVITFGVCTLDAATSDFALSCWTDDLQRSQLETLLTSLRVREIIHKKGQLSKETSRLIRNCVAADCRITMLRDGKEWLTPDATCHEITELFGDDGVPDAIKSVQDNEEAMSALAGMFAYLTQLSLLKDLAASKNFNLLDHRRAAGAQPMHLDANTLSHLCILANEDGSDAGTLHRLLNRTVTPAGKRLFKKWLTHPLFDIAAIRARQDAVDDLLSSVDFEDCFAQLKKMPDFERLIPKVYSRKIKPCEFTKLLASFKKMTPIVVDLERLSSSFASELVKSLLSSIPDVASLAADLDAMFIAEEDGSFQPRDGVDKSFDEAQALVQNVERRLEGELQKCRKQLSLGSQKNGGCNWKHRGTNEIYQIEVPKKTRVPNDWAVISQTNSTAGYYPPTVRSLVQSLKEARETRIAALKSFHAWLFEQFNQNAPAYLTAIRALAELDCLLSLAQASYSMGEPTCRPRLVECDTALVGFEELRHPCIAGTTDFIANDIQMGGDAVEVIVLTGGNMAGKSTTARTAATGVILAQLGCRVPAKSATLSPADRICSRMGANDQIFKNSSTFMVEMLEASRIVKACTPRSLVIMDELGRGTSTFDGHAIAHAVLHHLIARTRCLCFFLTHYLQLAYDFQGYPRCANKHMAVIVDDEQREVVFTYRLVDGVAESSYGTQVAHLAGVPAKICDRASDISKEFADATKQCQAQRTTSTLPMASLSDFAYLFRLGSGKAFAASNSAHEHAARQVASQLRVVRSQIQRITQGLKTEASNYNQRDRLVAPSIAIDSTSTSKSGSASSKYGRRSTVYSSAARRNLRRGVLWGPSESEDDASTDEEGAGTLSCAGFKSSRQNAITGKSMSRSKTLPTTPNKRVGTSSTCLARPPAKEQLILVLGQKLQVTCKECGMSYDRSCRDDMSLHLKHHDRTTKGVEWSNKSLWASGDLLDRFQLSEAVLIQALGKSVALLAKRSITCSLRDGADGGGGTLFDLEAALSLSRAKGDASSQATLPVQILRYSLADGVTKGQPTHGDLHDRQGRLSPVIQRKVAEILETVDASLGASRLTEDTLHDCLLFVAVACNRVVGCLVVTTSIPAGTARRVLHRDVLHNLEETSLQAKGNFAAQDRIAHGTTATSTSAASVANDAVFACATPLNPAETPRVGVHRIYVLPALRRRGIARHLLDAVLDHAVYGMDGQTLVRTTTTSGRKSDVIAFSQPTDAGRSLARAWLQEEDLIIFQE